MDGSKPRHQILLRQYLKTMPAWPHVWLLKAGALEVVACAGMEGVPNAGNGYQRSTNAGKWKFINLAKWP